MNYSAFENVLSSKWMGIDTKSLLYGLDHVPQLSRKIDLIKRSPGHLG